jgi:YidC/Oxa1 family membrane protein insertase
MRENLNLLFASLLSVLIIVGWQYFYEQPKQQKIKQKAWQEKQITKQKSQARGKYKSREKAVQESERVKIESSSLKGSINLKGGRLDDLLLKDYNADIDPEKGNVVLLSPSLSPEAYFAELGWFSNNSENKELLPDSNSLWKVEEEKLIPENTVRLYWYNERGDKFELDISLDEKYMFEVTQRVVNNNSTPLEFMYYGLVNQDYDPNNQYVKIAYTGPIGVINENLEEPSYKTVKEKGGINFDNKEISWLGLTGKYWLTSLIPEAGHNYRAKFSYANSPEAEKYQADYLSGLKVAGPGDKLEFTSRIFAGAKKVQLLDEYATEYGIKLFDRAIDFGWFYFITKPLFWGLNYFYDIFHNFGISILLVTVIIKLLLFSVASKSFYASKKMKKIQPEMERLRELYGDDKIKFNNEVMALYKREKVNPFAMLLPLLIQIPIFFSLYKVLNVTIEMRHAPFFGWLRDLSAPDPSNILTLCGLLPFNMPSYLQIGVLPALFGFSQYLQQSLNPAPQDPVQGKMMKFLPLIFVFIFNSFPAGLVLYTTWNNILSIIQQYYINKTVKLD